MLDAMQETLFGVGGRDVSADLIDSKVVRAHHCELVAGTAIGVIIFVACALRTYGL